MMNRRKFLKTMSAASASVFIPSSLNLTSLYKHANAAVDYAGATIAPPAVMPQVINIFLYGGPSELAGNLTNIVDIDANSQNSYAAAFPGITTLTTDAVDPGLITPNGFWQGAGGDEMEFLVNPGAGTNPYMTVYRTLMKRKDGTRSHRESILMSLKGSLDIETSAGVGTRMAALLYQNNAAYTGVPLADGTSISGVENLLLPFVSFESDSRIYAPDPDFTIPLLLRGTTLDDDFDNPFTRNNNGSAATMDALVNKVTTAAEQARYAGVIDAFALREFLETKIASLDTANNAALPALTDANDIAANGGNAAFEYPQNSRFADTVKAAVTLAVENPSTMFLSLGGALGGWDDHNNGVDRYPGRMTTVMQTLQAAMWHIKSSSIAGLTPGGNPRTTTDNIIINVFGDFGRRVNLNGSQGWDHGNNQNLFTLGGAGVVSAGNGGATRTLGKVVGTTVRVGDSGTNNQFTNPAPGSYEFEPMSVAASVYSYMGVQNPQVVTADPEMNPTGDPAINETAT